MFCKYCGAKLIDSAVFCHECGKATCEQPVQNAYQMPIPPAPPVQPVYQQPVTPMYQQPMYQMPVYHPSVRPAVDPEQISKLERQALTFGILGLSLCMLGVPGIVFSSIASGKASAFKKYTGDLTGKALIGYRLAKAGKIVGIIMTVVLAFVVLALQSDVSYEYNAPFEYYDF